MIYTNYGTKVLQPDIGLRFGFCYDFLECLNLDPSEIRKSNALCNSPGLCLEKYNTSQNIKDYKSTDKKNKLFFTKLKFQKAYLAPC